LQPVLSDVRQLPALQLRQRDQNDRDLILRALFELKTDIMDIGNKLNEIIPHENGNKVYNDNDFSIRKSDIETMNYEDIEKEILKYLLSLHRWNITSVSKILGQSERNIYRKIKKFKIEKPDYNIKF
jgi:transcriptional regulator of acetoin/glycerol metabolism